MPTHPALHFFRRWLALCPCPWPNQSIPGVNNANQWRTYDQIDKTSQLTWIHSLLDQRIKVVAISSSRASSGRIPAHRRSQVSRDDRTTKDGSKSYLLRLLCSAASTASPFASLCELTRDCVTSSDHGPRGLVASPLHCNAPIPSGPTQGGGDSGRGRMYVAQPAKKNGGSAAVARSWGQRRGVAAPGWVRNTLVGAGTAPAAP